MNFDCFNCRTASSTIDNNIDVSIEVKMYSETSFRLIKGDFSLHSDSQKRLRQLYFVCVTLSVSRKYFNPQEDCVAHLLIYNLTFVNLKLKVNRESRGTKVIRNPKLPGVLNKIDNGGNKIEESIPLFEGD